MPLALHRLAGRGARDGGGARATHKSHSQSRLRCAGGDVARESPGGRRFRRGASWWWSVAEARSVAVALDGVKLPRSAGY